MQNIGEIIREHRKKKNLTQEALGKLLFVSKQTVSKWETGKALPDVDTLRRLSQILQIGMDALLGGTAQEAKKSRGLVSRMAAVLITALVAVAFLSGALIYQGCQNARGSSGYLGGMDLTQCQAREVSMLQLIADPERFDGCRVRVIGVGSLGAEGSCIALSKEDLQYSTGNAIRVELDSCGAERFNGEYVVVEGVFHKDGSIREISRYQLWDAWKQDFYTIERNDDLTYRYKIADRDGEVLFSGDSAKQPKIEQIGETVIGCSVQTGTGLSTNWVVFCDVERSLTSEVFRYVLAARGAYVIYVDFRDRGQAVIVQDIFDPAAYCKEYILEDVSPVAADAVVAFELKDDDTAAVTYLKGENYTKTEMTIEIP